MQTPELAPEHEQGHEQGQEQGHEQGGDMDICVKVCYNIRFDVNNVSNDMTLGEIKELIKIQMNRTHKKKKKFKVCVNFTMDEEDFEGKTKNHKFVEQQKMALLDLKGKLNNGEQTEYPKKLEQIFWNERELQVDASDNVVHLDTTGALLGSPYIPKSIGLLTKLTKLILSDHALEHIPKEIGNLTKLKTLDVSCNKLTTIPKEIGKLTNLVTLNVSSNRLNDIPAEIENLVNLECLDMCCNDIENIRKEVGELENLRVLAVCCNKLTVIPDHIYKLKKIVAMFFQCNKITEIPLGLGWKSIHPKLMIVSFQRQDVGFFGRPPKIPDQFKDKGVWKSFKKIKYIYVKHFCRAAKHKDLYKSLIYGNHKYLYGKKKLSREEKKNIIDLYPRNNLNHHFDVRFI